MAKVSPKEFIRAWQTSDSVDEVAAKTGMNKSAIGSRASLYRSKGIQLKSYRPARVNWEVLVKYAESLAE